MTSLASKIIIKTENLSKQGQNQEKNYRIASKKYNKISFKTRKQLIERVLFNKESLIKVSRQLQIKISTSKFIIKRYKKDGKIFKKKSITQHIYKTQSKLKQTTPEIQQQPIIQHAYFPCFIYTPIVSHQIDYQLTLFNYYPQPCIANDHFPNLMVPSYSFIQ